jgi:ubiquinol-cytochrome c reductase cytochrome b subunit
MMGTAFMGYVLPWGQMSFWGATVITGLFGAIPGIGEPIQTWLLGGPAVDNATLNRFFSLHYLLPFVIAALVVVHIWAFHTTGNNNPTGVEVRRAQQGRGREDTVPFWPYFVIKDLFALAVILAVFFASSASCRTILGHPDNYIEANPLATPAHIVPEWYFLPFYAILRAFTADVWVVIAGQLAVLRHHRRQVLRRAGDVRRDAVMALVPWLDTSSVRSGRIARCSSGGSAAVHRLRRADVGGAMPAEEPYAYDLADRLGLLVRLFPDHPAAAGCDREAAAQPATIEEDFNAHYGPKAIRPSERKPSMFRKSHSSPHRPWFSGSPSPPAKAGISRTWPSPMKARSASSTSSSCSAAFRSIPRSARPATG